MQLVWSITETEHGARSVDKISKMSKLGKYSKKRYNCSHELIFDFIPIHHVIIDTLHLFLCISHILIELLIRDIRILKEKKKDQPYTYVSPSTNNF